MRATPSFYLLLIASLAILTCATVPKLARQASDGTEDVAVYYRASRQISAGGSPYRNERMAYLYPPLFAFVLKPATAFGPVPFAVFWGVLLCACWVWALLVTARLTSGSQTLCAMDLVPSLILLRWILNGWARGQVALLLLALICQALLLERNGRGVLAALLIAIAGGIKVFPLYLAVLFIARRESVHTLLVAIFWTLLQLVPAIQIAPLQLWDMIQFGFFGTVAQQLGAQQMDWDNRAVVASLFRMFGAQRGPLLTLGTVMWAAFCTLLFMRLKVPKRDSPETNLWLALLLVSMLMSCPVIWPHYFTLLLFPVSASLAFVRQRPEVGNAGARSIVLVGTAAASVLLNVNASWLLDTGPGDAMEYAPNVGFVILWGSLYAAVLRLQRKCQEFAES